MCDGGSYVSSGTDAQAQAIFAGRRPVDDLAGWSYERHELWGTAANGRQRRMRSVRARPATTIRPSPVPCATAGLRPSPPRRPSRPSPFSTLLASARPRLVSWRSGCCGRVGRSAAVGVGRISGYLASVHRQREPHGRDHPRPACPACRRMAGHPGSRSGNAHLWRAAHAGRRHAGEPRRPGHRPQRPRRDRAAERAGDGDGVPRHRLRRHDRAAQSRPTAPTSSSST